MPLYQYRCQDCGHQFSERQRFSDDPLSDCPGCGGDVRRVINNVRVVFKGSGFYVTDNRNGSRRNGGARDGSADAPAESTSGEKSKSETKSGKGGESAGAKGSAATPPAAA